MSQVGYKKIHFARTIVLHYHNGGVADDCDGKARFPLPELTARVNGPS